MKLIFLLLPLLHISSAFAKDPGINYDRKMVRQKIRSNLALFKECYTTELKNDPNLAGKVSVQFEIGESGVVSKTSIKKSTIQNKNFEECLMTTLKTLKFQQPPIDQVAVVVYPFEFRGK